MVEEYNLETQPQVKHKVFNNWEVIPKGWYYLFQSREVPKGQVRSVFVGQQKLVVFRGESGAVKVLDSFCPHMGADLKIGKVIGDNLRCFFHHWQFDGTGQCTKIPVQNDIPKRAKINGYAVCEKYGCIWVYPDAEADRPLLEVPALEGHDVISSVGSPNVSESHHHISMINGIDPQHLATVHQLEIEMTLDVSEDVNHISFILEGPTPNGNPMEKMMRFMLGERYSYAMKYADACFACLTVLRNVYFLRKEWRWPELHMFYAYRPGVDGRSYTWPIYVAKKEKGFFGAIKSRIKLWMTKRLYFFLKDEDEIIYDNIRYNPTSLLKMDGPVTRYIGYVNRLQPSQWSRKKDKKRDS